MSCFEIFVVFLLFAVASTMLAASTKARLIVYWMICYHFTNQSPLSGFLIYLGCIV